MHEHVCLYLFMYHMHKFLHKNEVSFSHYYFYTSHMKSMHALHLKDASLQLVVGSKSVDHLLFLSNHVAPKLQLKWFKILN